MIDRVMHHLQTPVALVTISLGCYLLAQWVFIRFERKVWLHPLLITSLLLVVLIRVTPVTIADYTQNTGIFKTLLGPFTVALAIPLSQQMHALRRQLGAIINTSLMGGFMAVAYALVLAQITGASNLVMQSIGLKSMTTAVAVVLAENSGALVPLTVGIVIICGIYGGLVGPPLCELCGIRDPRAVGFAMGLNAHAGGTARAFELNPIMGAYAGLGMCLGALLMPILAPWLLKVFVL